MVVVLIILFFLVLLNVLLLVFSCNDTEKEVKVKLAKRQKKLFYKPKVSGFRMLADK